jgi:hypothetical protein
MKISQLRNLATRQFFVTGLTTVVCKGVGEEILKDEKIKAIAKFKLSIRRLHTQNLCSPRFWHKKSTINKMVEKVSNLPKKLKQGGTKPSILFCPLPSCFYVLTKTIFHQCTFYFSDALIFPDQFGANRNKRCVKQLNPCSSLWAASHHLL